MVVLRFHILWPETVNMRIVLENNAGALDMQRTIQTKILMMTSSDGNIFHVTGLCAGNSPVTGEFPHKGQWRGALMFSLNCAWTNSWANNGSADDLRHQHAHYDVIVMSLETSNSSQCQREGSQVNLLCWIYFEEHKVIDLCIFNHWYSTRGSNHLLERRGTVYSA